MARAKRSLPKELYDITSAIRRLNVDAQGEEFDGQTVTRDACNKLTGEARNLAAWLFRDAK